MTQYGWATEGKEVVSTFADRVQGKTFVITGTSAGGIGAEIATDLASESPTRLILLGRSLEKIQPVLDSIASKAPKVVAKFVPVELELLSSVREAAQVILDDSSVTHIDALFNNAGVMAIPQRETTDDGLEKHLAVNHASHFLLTVLLMPKLLAAACPRVISISSYGHAMSGIRFQDPNFTGTTYQPWHAYAQSKTANILFTVGLNAKLSPGKKSFRAYAVDPGSVTTSLLRHVNPETYKLALESFAHAGLVRPEIKTPAKGCAGAIRAALDPDLSNQEGVYLTDTNLTTDPKAVKDYAVDPANAERLWSLSEEWVGEKFEY